MDRRTLSLQQVLEFVREFKRVITPRYSVEPKVYLYGDLWEDIRKVNVLIEPVLLEDHEDSMLYREVMRTGIAA